MDLVYSRCAGLDVPKATVVACVRGPGTRPGERQSETKTFATTLRGLRELRAWLIAHGVTYVAMESTGVYWRPVFAVLEGPVQIRLVNARHVKMLPGRKTDVRDCEWLAQLLECGLLRGSFVPPAAVRDLRDLTPRRAPEAGRGVVKPRRVSVVDLSPGGQWGRGPCPPFTG